MTTSSELTGFNEKWQKLSNYARGQGWSQNAINQVYSIDEGRLKNGTEDQLSDGEIVAMIQSASQGGAVTPTPQQTAPFSVGRIPGYVGESATQFGVGLLGLIKKGISDVAHPTHAAHELEALWKNPAVLENPLEALVGLRDNALHDLWDPSARIQTMASSPFVSAMVPGIGVLGDLVKPGGGFSGKAGLEYLAENPVSSAFDVLPDLAGAGDLGRALARSGLDEGAQAALKEAAKYRPTDLSNEAVAARQAAREAVTANVRTAFIQSQGGLFGTLKGTILQMPFQEDNIGSYVANRINELSGGRVGPLSVAVGRMVQGARRTEAKGAEELIHGFAGEKGIEHWYTEHGLTTPKEIRDFGYLTTHYRADWRSTMALEPGEADKLDNALSDYDNLVMVQTNKDLASGRLAMVRDPRTGEVQYRGTEGEDATVVRAYNAWLKARSDVQRAGETLADLTGTDIPHDPEAAKLAVLNSLRQAIEPAKAFIAMDPRRDQLAISQAFSAKRTSGAWASATRLMGERGMFAQLAKAIAKGDFDTIKRLLNPQNGIPGMLKGKYLSSNPALEAMRGDMLRARDTVTAWSRRDIGGAFDRFDKAQKVLEKALDRRPEARLLPRMTELVQDRLLEHLSGQEVTPEDLQMLTYQVAMGDWRGETYASVVGAGEMRKIGNSALLELRREQAEGLNPRFVYSARQEELPRIGRVGSMERIAKSRSSKSRALWNPTAVYDPIIGLTRKMLEDLHEDTVRELFYGEDGIEKRWKVSADEPVRMAQRTLKLPDDPALHKAAYADFRAAHYSEITPEDFFSLRESRPGTAPNAPILVPKEVADTLRANIRSIEGFTHAPGVRLYSKGTQVFRVALLGYSPRYQAHIWLGGTVLGLLVLPRSGVDIATNVVPALGMMIQNSTSLLRDLAEKPDSHILAPVLQYLKERAARKGELEGLRYIPTHGLAESDPQFLTNHFNYSAGSKLARWFAEARAKSKGLDAAAYVATGQAGLDLASFGADMLRAVAYLSGKDEALRAGATDLEAVEAGGRMALKVYADMDGMSPLERSIIRYVMPFYGWTKHILTVVFKTLPEDHPVRLALVSQMVNQEWADWNTSIPQSMMYLFQIGGVGLDGNVNVLDVRQLDPLRSVTDVFTLAGFLSSLNPAIQNVVLPALGIDPASGGPEDLYPSMSINEFYGTEQGVPTGLGTALQAGIAGYIPQASALETALGTTAYAQWAKQNDPVGFRNTIYQALNMPWVPYKVSIPATIATTEERNYNVARDAATAALEDPDPNSATWKALMQYAYVPYSDWMVQPQALRQWAFDSVQAAGYWNPATQMALLPPSNVVVAPYPPNY